METFRPIASPGDSPINAKEELLSFYKKVLVARTIGGTIKGTIYALAPLGLLTNLSFLYAIARVKSMRTVVNVYLANLAVADMLCLVFHIVNSSTDVTTEAFHSWALVYQIASSCFVTALAFQRCFAVRRPLTFRANFTKGQAVKVTALLWLSAVGIGLVCRLAADPDAAGMPWAVITPVLVLCFLLIVLIIDMTLHLYIYWKLRQQPPLSPTENPHRRACRVARMLIVNTAVFFTLNMVEFVKLAVVAVVNGSALAFRKTEADETLFYLYMIAIILQVLNCSIDPVVYGATNKDYRKAVVQAFPFLKFLRCCRRGRVGPSPPVEEIEMKEVRQREPNRE